MTYPAIVDPRAAELASLRAQVAALQAREGRLMAMAVEARRHMASVNEESPAVEAVCVILERMQARAP